MFPRKSVLAFALVLGTSSFAAADPQPNPAPAAPADQIFSFVDSTITLKPDQSAGSGYLSIHLEKPPKNPPEAVDFSTDGVGVTFGAPKPADASKQDWFIPATVRALDRDKTVTHHLLLTVDGATQRQDYTITNAPVGTYKLDIVSFPGTVAWSSTQPITATVMVGPVPANEILVNAILTDEMTKQRFGGGALKLCETPTPDCKPIANLPANTSRRVFLQPLNGIAQPPGKYTGGVEIVASGNRGTSTNIVVYVTNTCVKLLGCLLLIAGIALSLGTTLLVRNRLARAQLLAPAAALFDAFGALDTELNGIVSHNVPKSVTNTKARIADWRDLLSAKALESASIVPPWWSTNPVSPAISQTYQTLLDNAGAWRQVLSYMIGSGFEPLAAYDFSKLPAVDQATKDAFTAVWAAIDVSATPLAAHAAPDLAAVVTTVKTQLAAAQAAYKAAQKTEKLGFVGDTLSPSLARPVSASQHIRYQIATLSLVSWGIAALLTALVGSYALIFSQADFGRTSDLFACLFWGLGLPTTASALAQMNPGSVSATVGVNLPKAPAAS